MTHSIDQVFSGNLPWFVPAPSETDTLMVVMGAILVLFVLVVGILYFRLHALPERFLKLFDLVCLSFLRAGFERHIKRLGGIAQRLAVQNIFMRQSCNRFCQVAQNLGEQRIVKMHANRFALLVRAGYLQAQRYTVLVEVSVESRSMRECSDVELVGIFHRDFRFIENRPGHNNCTWALAS